MYDDHLNSKIPVLNKLFELDLSFLEAPDPFRDNCEDVLKNTDKWFQFEHKVGGNHLQAFLRFYGPKNLTEILSHSQNGNRKHDQSHLNNFSCGHFHEKQSLRCFEADSKCKLKKGGLPLRPNNKKYGFSSDPSGPKSKLIEVKRREEKSDDPLNMIANFLQYSIHCYLQRFERMWNFVCYSLIILKQRLQTQ